MAFDLTSSMVQPILSAVVETAPVLVPVGIGIMAVMIGASAIPRIIYKFF